MYIDITPGVSKETGNHKQKSVASLVHYLTKEEDQKKTIKPGEDEEQDLGFFNATQTNIHEESVIASIDDNARGKGLKDNEARFYNLVISPSQEELSHIEANPQGLQHFTRQLMDVYAEQFDRVLDNGKKLTGDDIVWFARMEHERVFSFSDKEVRHNNYSDFLSKKLRAIGDPYSQEYIEVQDKLHAIKGYYYMHVRTGDVKRESSRHLQDPDYIPVQKGLHKPGDQRHVHIIVSRFPANSKTSISPMANNRKGLNTLNGQQVEIGFNRKEFRQKAEALFDISFDYQRPYRKSFEYAALRKRGKERPLGIAQKLIRKSFTHSGFSYLGYNQLKIAVTDSSGKLKIDNASLLENMSSMPQNMIKGFQQYIENSNVALKILRFAKPDALIKLTVDKTITKSFGL